MLSEIDPNDLIVPRNYGVAGQPHGVWTQLRKHARHGLERASRRSGYMISSELHDFGKGYLRGPREASLGVTPENVMRAASKHLHPGRCRLAAAGPIKVAELKRALRGA